MTMGVDGELCVTEYRDFTTFLVHALVLPVSTTDCEHFFSVKNHGKNDFRNHMHT